MTRLLALALGLALGACSEPGGGDTSLPTKERTVGRVQQGLQSADDEAAKRRARIDQLGASDQPGK